MATIPPTDWQQGGISSSMMETDGHHQEEIPGQYPFQEPSPLTTFGQWVEVMCVFLDESKYVLAARAGLDRSTLTRLSRVPTARPHHETVEAIYQAFEAIAKEKNLPLTGLKTEFFNACGFSTLEQQEGAGKLLSMLQIGAWLCKESYRMQEELTELRKSKG